ncbi:MAG: nucleotidyltransferase family protein [Candidatus Sumerlaeaceae bacterium]
MESNHEDGIRRAAAALVSAGAKQVYVFGSAADNTMHEASDVDLAVSGLPPRNFFRAMGQAQRELGRPLDLVDLDEDTPFTRCLHQLHMLRRVA